MRSGEREPMTEFEQKKKIYEKSWRGTYLIIPIKVSEKQKFNPSTWRFFPFDEGDGTEELFPELSDKSDLIKRRCQSGYVKKYMPTEKNQLDEFKIPGGIRFSNIQLYLFENGIGFLTLFIVCPNQDIHLVYNLVNNGYIGTKDGGNTYEILYDTITEVIEPLRLEIFTKDKSLLLNEAYVQNVAFVSERFEDLETLEQVTLNAHKQIGLERDFEDKSEKDIRHIFGARDVTRETYRWGACISTLDISFVYQNDILKNSTNPEEICKSMLGESAGDLLLTILALVQKYACMQLNADIHNEFYENGKTRKKGESRRRRIKQLKKRALNFRAFGTLAPSQVSRWNNVCEAYRDLLEVHGIDEALVEIEQKIDLLNAEQEQQATEKQNLITTVITVFGFVSIVASILTMVDLVLNGGTIMAMSLVASTLLLLILAISWVNLYIRK